MSIKMATCCKVRVLISTLSLVCLLGLLASKVMAKGDTTDSVADKVFSGYVIEDAGLVGEAHQLSILLRRPGDWTHQVPLMAKHFQAMGVHKLSDVKRFGNSYILQQKQRKFPLILIVGLGGEAKETIQSANLARGLRRVTRVLSTLNDTRVVSSISPMVTLSPLLGGCVLNDVYQEDDSSITYRLESHQDERMVEAEVMHCLRPERVTHDTSRVALMKTFNNAKITVRLSVPSARRSTTDSLPAWTSVTLRFSYTR